VELRGAYRLAAMRPAVWAAFHDAAVLREAVPGCRDLRAVGPGRFSGRVVIDLPLLKGLYEGTVTLSNESEPERLTISLAARGRGLRVEATGRVRLEEATGGTDVAYRGEVEVHGLLGVVARGVLHPAAHRLLERFFRDLARALAGWSGAGPPLTTGL
jgi:hypothetical protein